MKAGTTLHQSRQLLQPRLSGRQRACQQSAGGNSSKSLHRGERRHSLPFGPRQENGRNGDFGSQRSCLIGVQIGEAFLFPGEPRSKGFGSEFGPLGPGLWLEEGGGVETVAMAVGTQKAEVVSQKLESRSQAGQRQRAFALPRIASN